MPLKIRCPHCRKVLLAEDETAGQEKRCPACDQIFTVPLPLGLRAEPSATDVASRCPRCGADVAPGTAICRKCSTNVTTGERLSLGQRLRRTSLRTWTLMASIGVGAVLIAYIGVEIYLARFRPPSPDTPTFQPIPHTPFAAEEWAERLLSASSTADRLAARDKLVHGGALASPQVAQAVAAALAESLNKGKGDYLAIRNQRAALDVLARAAEDNPKAATEFGQLLESCQRRTALREDTCLTRAQLGDCGAFRDVRDIWLRELRQRVFLMRLAELTECENDPAVSFILKHAQARTAATERGLRRLVQRDEAAVLDDLMDAYWQSWVWLGHTRGARVAAQLFELAKPYEEGVEATASDFDREKLAIRGARDALQRVGQRAAPTARAAAGLVLAHAAPQYSRARERIEESVAALLPDCDAPAQQQLTWALSRLTGRQFGQITPQNLPIDVRRPDVEAVLHWARSRQLIESAEAAAQDDDYPKLPDLACRIMPPVRQLERDLLRELKRGWPQAADALDRWTEAGLGCTDGLLTLLDPGQRQPNYPALAAAMVIAADSDPGRVRRQLTLWREATDQPGWVRQLAYTALGALDAQRGRWSSGWPAGLDPAAFEQLGSDGPDWHCFGRILAIGGSAMVERLQRWQPAPLPPETMARLIVAAEEAARSKEWDGRP